ncbi:MAG TPA: dihydrolipoyl dehydrogenase [Vicinamibacterales bacterium]|jgi:dihydrolipoamide dehydrogenase|nr:dihydrolipoyl dehydrogenase [Vicinamibacterales bacterium]
MSSSQLVVIGGGPGGYAAAFHAADLGLQVALVDNEPNPGGVCLYRGCIPSKALLHVAKLIAEAKHASNWGVSFADPKIDLVKLRTFKDGVVQKLTGGLGQLSKQRKITYIQGRASFVDAKTLSIDLVKGGTDTLTFEHAIIATGSRPAAVPSLSLDSPRVMDSTAALDLPDAPKSLLVVGGGYIGLELGSVYAALGTKVTVVEMTGGLLPGADRDLVAVLSKRLEQTLHKILVNARVVEMKDGKNGVTVKIEGEGLADADKTQTFDRVLVSVGRKPNSAIPGLDKTAVKVGDRGFIAVDASMRTAEPNIFAIGDVVGEPMLAHKASHEARVAVESVLGHHAVFEPQAIPAVVFTDPEVAWCGLTEAEAKKQGRKVEIAKFPWAALGRAIAIDRPDGLTKLVIDPDTERVLGVGIVGAGAGELIAEGVLAVEMAALATDLKLTIHPHPTLSETLMEAAEAFFGESVHIYRPKKK